MVLGVSVIILLIHCLNNIRTIQYKDMIPICGHVKQYHETNILILVSMQSSGEQILHMLSDRLSICVVRKVQTSCKYRDYILQIQEREKCSLVRRSSGQSSKW